MEKKEIIEIYEIVQEKMNKIIEGAWSKLDNKLATINDRTKIHTIQIRELRKEINDMKD